MVIGGWTTVNIPIDPDNGDSTLVCPYKKVTPDGGSTTSFTDFVVQVPEEPTREGFIFAGWELLSLGNPTGYFFKGSEIITTQSSYMSGNYFKISNVWGSDQGPNGDGNVSAIIANNATIKAKWIQPLLVVGDSGINATTYTYNDHGTNKEVKKIIYKESEEDPGTKIVDTNSYTTYISKVTRIMHETGTNQATNVVTYYNQVPMYKRFALSVPHSQTKDLYGQILVSNYAKFELVAGNKYLAIKNKIYFPYDAVPPNNITAVVGKSYPLSTVNTAVFNWNSQTEATTYDESFFRPDLLEFEYKNFVNTNRTKYDLFHKVYNPSWERKKGLQLIVVYTSTRISTETFQIKFHYSFKVNAIRDPSGSTLANVKIVCTNNAFNKIIYLPTSTVERTYTGVFIDSIVKSATTSPIVINIDCEDHSGYSGPNVTVSDLYISPIVIVEQ